MSADWNEAVWILKAIEDAAENRAIEWLVEHAELSLETDYKTGNLKICVEFGRGAVEGDPWCKTFNETAILADTKATFEHYYADDLDLEYLADRATALRRLANQIEALPLPPPSAKK